MSVSKGQQTGYSGIAGGWAPLDSGLLIPRSYLPQIAGLLHKMDGTTAPTVNDDAGDGYGIGSRWLDTTNDIEYVCLDATVAAAVWRESAAPSASSSTTDSSVQVLAASATVISMSPTLIAGTYIALAHVRPVAMTATASPGSIQFRKGAVAFGPRADLRDKIHVPHTIFGVFTHTGGAVTIDVFFMRESGTTTFGITSDTRFSRALAVFRIGP